MCSNIVNMADEDRKEYLIKLYHDKFKKLKPELQKLGFFNPADPKNAGKKFSERQEEFNSAAADVLQSLVNDVEEKIITMTDDYFIQYFKSALSSNRKDTIKKDTKHIRAKIIHTGELPVDFESLNLSNFKKGNIFKHWKIEALENMQTKEDLPTVKYLLITDGEIKEMPGAIVDDEGNEIDKNEEVEYKASKDDFDEKEEKRDNENLLSKCIKILNYACQMIVLEKLDREKDNKIPFTWDQWAKEKKEKKETLKTRYFRCFEKLRIIVRNQEEQIA